MDTWSRGNALLWSTLDTSLFLFFCCYLETKTPLSSFHFMRGIHKLDNFYQLHWSAIHLFSFFHNSNWARCCIGGWSRWLLLVQVQIYTCSKIFLHSFTAPLHHQFFSLRIENAQLLWLWCHSRQVIRNPSHIHLWQHITYDNNSIDKYRLKSLMDENCPSHLQSFTLF